MELMLDNLYSKIDILEKVNSELKSENNKLIDMVQESGKEEGEYELLDNTIKSSDSWLENLII